MQVSDTDSKWLNPLRHGGLRHPPPTPPDYPHRPALELTVFKAVSDLCQWQFLAEPCQAQIPPHARAWRRSIFWNCHSNMRPLNFLSCSACFFVRLGLVMIEKIAKSPKIYFPIHAPFILRGSWYLSSWRFPFVHRKQLLVEGHGDIPSLYVFSHDSFQKNIHLCILSNRHWEMVKLCANVAETIVFNC